MHNLGAVMAAEQALGHEPREVSQEKRGYDIESRVPGTADQPSRVGSMSPFFREIQKTVNPYQWENVFRRFDYSP